MATLTTRSGTYYILADRRYTVHVCSDNAMIDSGHRRELTIWRDDLNIVARMEVCTGRDETANVQGERDSLGNLTLQDIPQDIKDAAERYTAALAWFQRMTSAAYAAQRAERAAPAVGERVQVFKGRKVPLGVYTIRKAAVGTYGPYYDLQDSTGRVHNFIAQSNCRPAKPSDGGRRQSAIVNLQDEGIVPYRYVPFFLALAQYTEAYVKDEQRAALGALLDVMEDSGDLQHLPALRAHWAAFCTDAGTRQFYGW